MTRLLSFLLFLGIALIVLGAAHYYVWIRLVRDPHLPRGLHRGLSIGLFLLYFLMPVTMWLGRGLRPELAKPVALVTFSWMGLLFFTVVVLAATDLVRGAALFTLRRVTDGPPLDPERRQTLARLLAGGVSLLVAGLGGLALRNGYGRFLVRDVVVPLGRLPRALDGLRIAQLTDVHIGPTLGREFLEDVVATTNSLEPDVIAITGDLVDGSVEHLRHHVEPLRELRARYGVYFVTGNHEFYSGADEWCAELTRLGIRVLRNERVAIGDGEDSFDLAGVEDYNSGRFGPGPDLPRALAGRDPSRELVLLAHQPRAIFEAEKHGVGLQLSGHTHGGQLWPWNFLVKLQQPVVSGLERIGRALIYVSNGTGFWGPPMRLGFPAEITNVVLRSEQAQLTREA